ncbi:outer membrane lipoprotein carrier protein LolA [Streptomyces sp. NPDC050145]|uniref:outer membrane lipoprotein carrier protein LolA n=1 Tax=Streptomyces sp. NPDC050145 TaxID=3365602 RepID=UPI00378831BE
MAPYAAEDSQDGGGAGTGTGRRRAARYAVPAAVIGVAAATIGLVPALADSGDPDLPKTTAQELLRKIAASDTEQLSGTVKIHTDLGLPSLGGGAAGMLGGAGGGEGGGEGPSSADPKAKLTELATGTHTLRVAADGPDRQKLSILEDAAEYSVIHNGSDVWAYDSKSNEAYHAKDTGRHDAAGDRAKQREDELPATPKELTDEILKASGDTTSFSVDGTSQVAGRDAYRLQIKPKQSGSTVGAITIAVDAKTGTPLKFTLTPASGGAAVVDAGFTSVDFGKPAASTFDFKPAKGTKVTEADELKGKELKDHELPGKGERPGDHPQRAPKGAEGVEGAEGLKVIGEGWTSIAELKLPEGAGLAGGGAAKGDVPADAQKFLDSLGDRVKGDFGTGTVYSTRLVNVLITEDGKAYAGAVTKEALVKAAEAR